MSDENPSYDVEITEDAEASLANLDRVIAKRIAAKIDWLVENADSLPHEALTGDWSGCCRMRVGAYRVIYAIDKEEKTLEIVAIGHRRDVY